MELQSCLNVVQGRSKVIFPFNLTPSVAQSLHAHIVEIICAEILSRVERHPVRLNLTRLWSLLNLHAHCLGLRDINI